MQIIDLELDHYNFYSPSTGGVIMDGDVFYDNEKSLMGYWLDEFWRDPNINSELLEQDWKNYLSNFESLSFSDSFTNEFQLLEDFFVSLKFDNVVVFKITDRHPFTPTIYILIDMNYCES